jgi:hypothetical protein
MPLIFWSVLRADTVPLLNMILNVGDCDIEL